MLSVAKDGASGRSVIDCGEDDEVDEDDSGERRASCRGYACGAVMMVRFGCIGRYCGGGWNCNDRVSRVVCETEGEDK